ncbi:hypothetical protein [Noviherbaspirillum aerium]|uniref:hypothetical protein n=1 Tax=Noviherbaspirillum aerium TaxID=2588497 RepID=UPI00124ED72C|nr:hypothetical protein [Noviherbaspirillum aerium]
MIKLILSYIATTTCSWTLAFLIPLYVLELTGSAAWTAMSSSVSFFAKVVNSTRTLVECCSSLKKYRPNTLITVRYSHYVLTSLNIVIAINLHR